MADYYPLLAKALAGLPSTTTPDARRAIYERARKALIGQLRSLKPPLAEEIIAREEAALDAAVARLEGERAALPAAATPSASPTSSPPAPASAPPSSGAASPPPASTKPAARPLSAPPRASAASSVGAPAPQQRPFAAPAAAIGAAASAGARTMPAPASVRPTPSPSAQAPGRPSSAAPNSPRYAPPPRQSAPPPVPGRPGASARPASSTPPPIGSSTGRSAAAAPPVEAPAAAVSEDGYAPPIAAAQEEAFAAPPVRAAGESGRPAAPSRLKPRTRSPWPWIALALVVAVVAISAGFAVLWKEKPQDLAIKDKDNIETPAKPGGGQSKIVERVAGGAAPTTSAAPAAPAPAPGPAASPAPAAPSPQAPAGAETPIPTVTVPTVPVRPNETAQAQAGAQAAPTQPPAAGAAAVSRAALLMETPNDPQKPKVVIGTATWSLLPAASGQAQTAGPAVQAEIDIPDAKMHATVTIRKNIDASLPATHTIDLRFAFADGSDIKGFKDMALPQMRRDDTPTGDAFSGVRVKINDGYFLVGLTRSEADTAHNLDLLNSRNWLDFPLLFADDHIAKLTFEKGASGQSVIAQAIEAWK